MKNKNSQEKQMYQAVLDAIQLAGSQRQLGKIASVSQQSVSSWKLVWRRIPVSHVLTLEKFFGVKLSRHYQRPDIYPL